VFSAIVKQVEDKREETLNTVNGFYENNTKRCEENLSVFNSKLEQIKEIKDKFENYQSNDFVSILANYNEFSKEYLTDTQRLNFEFTDFKFINDDLAKVGRFLSSICDIKTKQHQVNFIKLVLSNGKFSDGNEETHDERKYKQKGNKKDNIEDLNSSEIQKRLDLKNKNNDNAEDFGLSKLKKELLFNNNRFTNQSPNTISLDSRKQNIDNKLVKSSNYRDVKSLIDYENINADFEVFKAKKKNKANDPSPYSQNLFSSGSQYGENKDY